jgi:hypothetical protein
MRIAQRRLDCSCQISSRSRKVDRRARNAYPVAMSSGKCLCGGVRFEAENVEAEYHACHCGMCRRWSGGSPFFAAHAERVVFEGEALGRFDSSEWAQRGFCRSCGTTLFYFLKPSKSYMLSVGAFDDQSPFRLVREIFIDHKPAGYDLAGDHPRWTEAETLARLTPSEPS